MYFTSYLTFLLALSWSRGKKVKSQSANKYLLYHSLFTIAFILSCQGHRGIYGGLLSTKAGHLHPELNGCTSRFPRVDGDFDLKDVLSAVNKRSRTDLGGSAHSCIGLTPYLS